MLDDGRKISIDMVKSMVPEDLSKIQEAYGDAYDEKKTNQATELFLTLVTQKEFEEFLTIRAYNQLD